LIHNPNKIQSVAPIAIGAFLAIAGLCFAQNSGTTRQTAPPSAQPAAQPEAAPPPVELSITPTDLDSLGARVFLPVDASAQTTIIPGGKSKTVIAPEDQTWLIQMFVSISGNKSLTPTDALTAVVEQRKAQLGGVRADGKPASLVQEAHRVDNLVLAEMPASRAYVYEPMDTSVPVTGYTLVNTAPGRFLVIQLDCARDAFEKARSVYETVCAATQFPATHELDTERSAAITAGRTFLATIVAEDLDHALDPTPQFFRIYIPGPNDSPNDAREVGYQKISIRKGQLGELSDPDGKKKSSWNVDEREFGYLVRVDARMLQDQWVFDSRALFFLSLDRQRESWSILVEQKTGSSVSKSTQTLVRSGTRLSVRTERPGLPPEAKDYDLPEDQYISAVERYMLPKIVAHKVEPDAPTLLDMAFYTFDTARGNVTLRHETFDRAEKGYWTCETIPSEDQPSWTSTYTTDGELITRLMPPLQVMEPSTSERISSLWKNKKLPIE